MNFLNFFFTLDILPFEEDGRRDPSAPSPCQHNNIVLQCFTFDWRIAGILHNVDPSLQNGVPIVLHKWLNRQDPFGRFFSRFGLSDLGWLLKCSIWFRSSFEKHSISKVMNHSSGTQWQAKTVAHWVPILSFLKFAYRVAFMIHDICSIQCSPLKQWISRFMLLLFK